MLKKVAFVLALTICVSFALALESGPSNTVGFVKITCPQMAKKAFGLPFTFWDVVSGVPQYGVTSARPSDVIGAQLTGGTLSTGDQCIRQAGSYAYRTTTAALWAGGLETTPGMTAGGFFWLWNRHAVSQDMVLAGQVDTSTFGPIWIAANVKTGLSFRDARVVNRANLNLRTSGFVGGTLTTSDQVIEHGGSYCYFRTSDNTWQGGLVSVTPGRAYWLWNKHAAGWNYNYGPGAVSRPPDRPGSDDGKINVNRPPSRPSNPVR
ncbi:MAG: hypothetical protein V1784_03835 [bacterium]